MRIPNLPVALLLANALLVAPQWLTGTRDPDWIALEAVLAVGLFALLPRRRWSGVLAAAAAIVLVLLSSLAVADATVRQSLGRSLNLYLDVRLLSSVQHLLSGTLGTIVAAMVIPGLILSALLLTCLLAYLLSPSDTSARGLTARVSGVALIAISALGLTSDRVPILTQRMGTPVVQIATEQTRQLLQMLSERERFAAASAATPASYAELPGLLQQLRGRDVLLAFVESYGVSALYDSRYAPVVQSRLEDLAARMSDAGLHLATGTLVAPTQGGQSWFSHGSLLSGIWLDNQMRYDLLLASGRETLIDDFSRAGHRTVALMPATTLPWPEGEQLGYDQILAYRDIDYAGPALNWVTMPDQFTWSFLQRTVRASNDAAGQPLFAELSLISSHAPWTPILPVLDDWDSIDDGSVFAPWENAGERPADLWRDSDRVREHFALSVDYAINAMTGYAEHYVDDRTLLIVAGDHQPAPLITGDNASRDVPVHVITGDRTLLQPFLDWGFNPGALPDPDRLALGMDAFRDWFVRAFSGPAAGSDKTFMPLE